MDVIFRSNNYTVNDMTTLMSGLINEFDKAVKTKSSLYQKKNFCITVCLVSDCNGLSKFIFMSPTGQTNPGRLFM